MGKGWSRRLPPLETEVRCSGTTHRIRWVRGSVVALDHTDLVAEQAMVALGAAPFPCLEIVHLATGFRDEAKLLLHWNQGLVAGVAASVWPAGAATLTLLTSLSTLPTMPPALASALRGHARLANLAPAVVDRIALARVVRLGRRAPEDEMEQLDLELAVSVRAKPALEACMRTWTRRPPHRLPHVECRLGDPEQPPAVAWDGGRACELRLSPRWLPEVWAPGLALVDGCFVLGVDRARGAAAEAQVVRWERRRVGEEAPVVFAARVRRSRNGWRLDWT